jgi:ATP-dependent DNA helicase RecQ
LIAYFSPDSFTLPHTATHPSPLDILGQVFGYADFRGPQQAIVEHVVGGGDALVLMPTRSRPSCGKTPAMA